MRIYIASSWKNYHAVELLTWHLEQQGHEVLSFVKRAVEDEGRGNLKFDVEAWIMSESGKDKFEYDTTSAMTADCVIYIGPSGVDAWAEVGAAWGRGVKILGLWTKGEQSGLMRRMIVWYRDVFELLKDVGAMEEK